ncbi:MAG: hypothetical protein ACPGVD_10810, partial [Flavobacteriales bacterium]
NNNKLNLQKDSLKDSINQNTLFKHKELYKFVIDSIFNYKSIDSSSVPHIEKMESVYTLDTQNGLSEIFSIALETRDCTSDSEYGGSITKKSYRFINKKKIKVKITKSSFNCDNFKFHGKIQNITKQTLGVYYMSWNKDQNKFTDFTDR